MRVLIVDDNKRMRHFLKSILNDLVTEVDEASDGLDAVNLYQKDRHDAVLMDIRMPVMDGIEATRRIVQADPSAKVIIVTDFELPEYRKEAGLAGVREFLFKGDLLQLHDMLAGLLPTKET
jgi:CheY-like chemotaxis protein